MRFVGIDLQSTRGRPLRPPLQMKHKKTASTKRACCFLEVTPGFEPGSEGFADLCLTTWPRHQLYKIIGAEAPKCHFGAGDEARTRYLHLGKVALYRMSYTRIHGASGRNRTNDTGIFSPLLYRLSYRGMLSRASALLSVNKMATRNGLEPSTSSVTGWRANRLHHRAKIVVGTTGLEPVTPCL